ncbi:MAG: NAD(P)H-hydrate dehydratase [Gammaproteobacteria bacterium]
MSKALYQTEAIKELEESAISQGITEDILMERAGEAAWTYLRRIWPQVRRIAVFCGGGRNGGDGFVVARLAKEANCEVTIITVGDYSKQPASAKQMQQRCVNLNIKTQSLDEPFRFQEVDLIVDAILGTGLSRALSGEVLTAVKTINTLRLPILALDVPTGINSDTGEVMGAAVYARHTITFIGLKMGLVSGPALNYIGTLSLATLNIQPDILSPASVAVMYDKPTVTLLKRPRDSHKSLFGHVVIVGGNYGMPGAARIAASAALRAGAGLVTVITRPEYAAVMNAIMPEIMCLGIDKQADLPEHLASATVWVIGPGLGHDRWAGNMMHHVVRQKAPIVIDADGLRWLAKHHTTHANWILTPHPGEAAELLDMSTAEVQADRLTAAKAIQQRYGGVIILKGAGSIIAFPEGPPRVCVNIGNPGMASAGMGDCLTGVIAALVAQRVPANEAAALAVWVHAKAGDLAAAEGGERGLLASDLLPHIRKLLNSM